MVKDEKYEIKKYVQKDITFILTSDKIFVRTAMQLFFLEPRTHYFRRRLRTIRIMIELGEIRDFGELAAWTGEDIEWIGSTFKYHKELKAI